MARNTADAFPDDETLRRFLAGDLPAGEGERIAAVLERNPELVTRLPSLDAPDQLIETLRGAATETAAEEPEMAKVIAKAAALVPAGNRATVDLAPVESLVLPDPKEALISPERTENDVLGLLAAAESPEELGRLCGYRVLRILGKGGMGVVFEAEDIALGRKLAMKVMLPSVAANPAARKRFLREARIAATVEHDNVVPIFQVGEDRGVPFLAMPMLRGAALDAKLDTMKGPMPALAIVMIGKQVAAGLAAAHSKGLIHRDIKPSNVWLETDENNKVRRAKILDFGLARAIDDDDGLTRPGAILGTPAYMAPEQARGQAVDGRADLFSLGCVLYHMATGKRPFSGNDPYAVLTALALDTPAPPIAVNPSLPAALSDLIMKLLAKDPADRPQTGKEVVEALAKISVAKPAEKKPIPTPLSSSPVVEPSPARVIEREPPSPASRSSSRSRRLVAAGLLGVLAVTFAAVVIIKIKHKDGTETITELSPGSKATVKTKDGTLVIVENPPEPEGKQAPASIPPKPLIPTPPKPPVAIAKKFPFDDLDPAKIPLAERSFLGNGDPAKAQPEIVGVLGSTSFKHWEIMNIVWDPTGKRVATCGGDGFYRLWDPTDGRLTAVFYNPAAGLAFSPDGTLLAGGPRDGGGAAVDVHDAATGKRVRTHTLPFPVAQFAGMTWSFGDRLTLASRSDDGKVIKIWDAEKGKELVTLTGHTARVRTVAFDHQGKRVATCGEDKTVRVWDVATGKMLKQFERDSADAAFRPDGKHLAASGVLWWGTQDPTVQVWDTQTWEPVWTLTASGGAGPMAYSPDGLRLACRLQSVERGNTAETAVWDATTGKPVRTLPGGYHTTGYWWVRPAFSPKGDKVVTPGQVMAHLWDVTTGKELFPPRGTASSSSQIVASEDGRWVVSTAADSTARVWDTATWTEKHSFPCGGLNGAGVAISPDGRFLAVPFQDLVRVRDLETGKIAYTLTLPGGNALIDAVRFRPDGKRLVASDRGRASPIEWDTETKKVSAAYEGLPKPQAHYLTYAVAYSPDGKFLAAGGAEGKLVIVWDTETGKEHKRFDFATGGIKQLTFSPDGKQLLIFGGGFAGVQSWDVASGLPLPAVGQVGVHGLVFAPNGRMATLEPSATVVVRTPETGTALTEVKLLPAVWRAYTIAIAPDGRHALVGQLDGTILIVRIPELGGPVLVPK